MGESFGAYTIGNDDAVMPSITSANIACGVHAGDPSVLRRTIRLAMANDVAIGAHPGFPDLVGFGRREMNATPAEVEDLVLYQVSAAAGMAAAEGARLQHVKPHGALYHQAVRDGDISAAIARAVAAADRSLIFFGQVGSKMLDAGRAAGLRVAAEGFADRAYEPDGSLASRRKAGSVIHDPDRVVARVLQMVTDGTVEATDGSTVAIVADTICVHGDTQGAEQLAARIKAGLERVGVALLPVGCEDSDG
jgi:UPF0271 protein